jgi:hypothetical protein
MSFPQNLGSVEYTLNVVLKGKRKYGGTKKWTKTLLLKVEVSRKAVGTKLEQLGVADAALGKTKHIIMVHSRNSELSCSWSILGLSFLGIRTIILLSIFLRDYCKFTPSKPLWCKSHITKLSEEIIVGSQ